MAAPTPTTRQDPNGRALGDGYPILITFASDPDIEFWEQSVTPPAFDGGDPVDATTQHNTTYRTKSPGSLIEVQDVSADVLYDPLVYPSVVAIINRATTVTVHFPDGSSLCFYGYLRSFKPNAAKEKEKPMATVTIVVTNMDPSDCSEYGPVYTAGPGTAQC